MPTFEISGMPSEALTIRVKDAYSIKDDLKARGYRFVAPGDAMTYWELVVPAADMPGMQAEAAWIKASGHTFRRAIP